MQGGGCDVGIDLNMTCVQRQLVPCQHRREGIGKGLWRSRRLRVVPYEIAVPQQVFDASLQFTAAAVHDFYNTALARIQVTRKFIAEKADTLTQGGERRFQLVRDMT